MNKSLVLCAIAILSLVSCSEKSTIDYLVGNEYSKRWVITEVDNEMEIGNRSWVFTQNGQWFPNVLRDDKWQLTDFGDQVFDHSYQLTFDKRSTVVKVFAQDFNVLVLNDSVLELKSKYSYYKLYSEK
jgi:hypothetical protein